ncbi:MAG TPA: hypothetical protein VFN34_00465 [Ornithinibacter sp.]|nr:hypothetical protein [Ornithinibacter sp.]
MTRVAVRSEALVTVAGRVSDLADEVRDEAARLAASARGGPPLPWGPVAAARLRVWLHAEAAVLEVVGPGGLWGEALALDALAHHLRVVARAYEEVEEVVSAVLRGVAAGADVAARGGWLTDGGRVPVVRPVGPLLTGVLVGDEVGAGRALGAKDLVAAGERLDGGHVRVLETARPGGGSAWVVVVPGTQEWAPRAGPNPFDLTTDVRAMAGEPTVAAAGVLAALEAARARSARSSHEDPVLLVGHSQGGILAAALASDAGFRARHHVTHVVTSGSPVALFPVPASVRVLSVEHTDDPVPRLDLTPNPASSSWVTVRAPRGPAPVDVASHRLEAYVQTLGVAESAPRGTVPGLDAWHASAGAFLGVPVRSVSEFEVARGWQNPPS